MVEPRTFEKRFWQTQWTPYNHGYPRGVLIMKRNKFEVRVPMFNDHKFLDKPKSNMLEKIKVILKLELVLYTKINFIH